MIKLSLKLFAIVVIIGLFFFTMSLMKNEPNNFNPDKEWKFLLVNKDTTNSK